MLYALFALVHNEEGVPGSCMFFGVCDDRVDVLKCGCKKYNSYGLYSALQFVSFTYTNQRPLDHRNSIYTTFTQPSEGTFKQHSETLKITHTEDS